MRYSLCATNFQLLALCILLVGCGGPVQPIQPGKILGSWQVDSPLPKSMVFTFRQDRTYELGVTGEPGGVIGRWEIQGDLLITDMGSVSNQFGADNIFAGVATASTNKITKLTDSRMVWRNSGEWKGMMLNRLKTTSPSPE